MDEALDPELSWDRFQSYAEDDPLRAAENPMIPLWLLEDPGRADKIAELRTRARRELLLREVFYGQWRYSDTGRRPHIHWILLAPILDDDRYWSAVDDHEWIEWNPHQGFGGVWAVDPFHFPEPVIEVAHQTAHGDWINTTVWKYEL